ncbi:class 3 adenylate cyclase [Bradyrhizobium sp. USDA 3256]
MQEGRGRIERRLSAIMAADVAGYSWLMHDDEGATPARLTELLASEVEPAVADHGGRIVKNTGDGFLAEFPSAVEAVRAALRFLEAGAFAPTIIRPVATSLAGLSSVRMVATERSVA